MTPLFVRYIVTALLWASVAALAFALTTRWTYWRRGRRTADSAPGWRPLLAIPKRYFVDLHHVVARDPFIARTHVAAAGGGVAALALVFVNYGLMLYAPWLDRLILLAALALLAGAAGAGWRRRRAARPHLSRLSRGPWDALPWWLGALALGLLLYVALPASASGSALCGALAVPCALLIAVGAFTLTLGATRGGPMKHALAGLLHLAFHPRQGRFEADFAARFAAYPVAPVVRPGAYSGARSATHSKTQTRAAGDARLQGNALGGASAQRDAAGGGTSSQRAQRHVTGDVASQPDMAGNTLSQRNAAGDASSQQSAVGDFPLRRSVASGDIASQPDVAGSTALQRSAAADASSRQSTAGDASSQRSVASDTSLQRSTANAAPSPRSRASNANPHVPPTALKPLDLERNEYGVGKPAEFRWNQLLGFDACVQCGKCEAACPAFAAGQPLNPKKLVQDLVTGMVGGTDAAYAGSPTPGIEVGQQRGAPQSALVPALIDARTLWSCTTCRACVMECPMLIEHVDAIVDMRRHQTLVHGSVPGKGPQVLASLRETGTAGGYDRAARYDWAVDLNARVARASEPVDVLLVAGEGAFDMRYQRTLRALVKVLEHAGVNYALAGDAETDTGDVARRLGDEATFRQMGQRLIVTLSGLRFARIVSADPHVVHCLRNEYRVLGARFEVVHHSALLAELVAQGRLSFGDTAGVAGTSGVAGAWRGRTLTYHDPCYLGRYNGETSAPRELLRAIGIEVAEMERHGLRGRCCGGGGGAPLTDIPGKRRIPDLRVADARAVGADVIAVACPNCTAMLEGVVGPRPEVLDVAELVAAALG